MRDYYTLNVNLPGGIVSPGALQTVLTLAHQAQVRKVRFGARQQLLMTVHYEEMRAFEKALKQQSVAYEVNTEQFPNIISSYCGEDVFRTGDWLRESEYHTLLDQFDYDPHLKVNLSDSNQSFTPFFTGNLNFIASPEPHFWYLYVRPKQSNRLFRWPDLVYTNDVGRLAQAVETALLTGNIDHREPDERALYNAVSSTQTFITQPATDEVRLPEFSLPYYEGFNRYGQRSWLGLYRRDEQFSVAFLLDVCALCLKTRVGELCVTPWKSLIIKGIEEKDRAIWSYILGKHNINVRHAANELAWQTEDHTDDGTDLKNFIVRHFIRNDTRTFGLCFGIQTRPKSERSDGSVFGSVLVRKRTVLRLGHVALISLYDIYYTENFNPNSRTYHLFERGLFKLHLPNQLNRLCRIVNAGRLTRNPEPAPPISPIPDAPQPDSTTTYQCPHCFTLYDETYGDTHQAVAAGTPFNNLPADYCCPTCDASKSIFTTVKPQQLLPDKSPV